MQHNAGRATPTTILRKREGKENDGREAKRNKMRGRRVSFAPDDELQTMHLYQKDNARAHEDMTDDSLTDLGNISSALPYSFNGFQTSSQDPASLESPPNMGVPYPAAAASPMDRSPLSMDLTNNSFHMQGHDDNGAPRLSSQQQQQPGSMAAAAPASCGGGHQEFTRNITSCVPALSTLVEEDEDGAFDAAVDGMSEQAQDDPLSPAVPAPGSAQQAPMLSPVSPFVLQAMRLDRTGASQAVQEDTDDLKNKWGFTPGAEDTLNVSHGRLVMGDATYNNVYGNATLGDITRSMRAGYGLPQALPPRSSAAAAAPAVQPPRQPPVPEMTLRLLEEDQQTAPRRQPQYGAGHASVASNKVACDLVPRSPDDTMELLSGQLHTEAPAVGSYTAQLLLGASAPQAAMQQVMEQYGGHADERGVQEDVEPAFDRKEDAHMVAGDLRSDPDFQALRAASSDPTAASSSALDVDVRAGSESTVKAGLPPSSAAKHARTPAASLLGDQADLTLDDFALPPELPTGNLASQHMQQQHQQQSSQHAPLSPYLAPQQQALASPYVAGRLQQQQQQSLASPYVAARLPQGVSPYVASRLQQGLVSPYVAARLAALPRQQPVAEVVQTPTLLPISFLEFLQLVEVRFLDDMRRRTSIIQPAMADLQAEAGPQTTGEVLDLLYVAGPRMQLTQATIEELASKVETVQSKVAQAEAAMARNNPPVFAAVQLANSSGLERLQDQMKLLKRICRLRNMMSWKQQRIQFEQELGIAFRSSMQAVQQEVQDMEVSLQAALRLEESAQALQARLSHSAHEEQNRFKLAQEQRQRRAMQLRQLQELQASNEQRAARSKAAEEQLVALQSKYEETLQQKLALQQRLQPLRAEGVLQETPGKRKPAGSSLLLNSLLRKQEQLEVLLGLQGLQIDAKDIMQQHVLTLTLHSQFKVQLQLPAPGASPACFTLGIQPLHEALRGSLSAEAVLPCLGSLCQGPLCNTPTPMSQLRSVLDGVLLQLSQASSTLAQLDALLLSLPLFARVQVRQEEGGEKLQLVFINVGASAKATLGLPLGGLRHMLTRRVPAELELELPDSSAAELLKSGIERALAGIGAGPTSLQQLCYAVHDGLEEAGGPSRRSGQAGAGAAARSLVLAAKTPQRPYNNPLFGPLM